MSAVSSHSGVWGGAPTAQRFSTIFSIQNGLSSHYNIVLLWITKKRKILIPFHIESIIVHLVMLSDVLWYMRLNLLPESRKRWSSLQRRGEVVGGVNSTLGWNPPRDV